MGSRRLFWGGRWRGEWKRAEQKGEFGHGGGVKTGVGVWRENLEERVLPEQRDHGESGILGLTEWEGIEVLW